MSHSLRRRLAASAVVAAAVSSAFCVTSSLPLLAAVDAHGDGAATEAPSAPRYSYADAIRESVRVPTGRDDDHNGQTDVVAVDVFRPREADKAKTKVPVILYPSPYFGPGDVAEKLYDEKNVIEFTDSWLDNYFVPRGYAVALVDMPASNRSTGCGDMGGPVDSGALNKVVDWLNGRAKAVRVDGKPAVASWSSGKVGATGMSAEGWGVNLLAAGGVAGLVTAVPIAAPSSWYEFALQHRGKKSDDDPVTSAGGTDLPQCKPFHAALAKSAGRSFEKNSFFMERDLRTKAGKSQVSVFVVHGIADYNVRPSHATEWWAALGEAKRPRKMWLMRSGHDDPFNVRRDAWVSTLHRWFDFWLLGRRTGIMDEPPVTVQRPSGEWVDEIHWPAGAEKKATLPLGGGPIGVMGAGAKATAVTLTDAPDLTEEKMVRTPNTKRDGRLVFLSGKLTQDLRVSGVASAALRVRVNKETTMLSARIVDYGSAKRVGPEPGEPGTTSGTTLWCMPHGDSDLDPGCWPDMVEDVRTADLAVLARGSVDAAHRSSLSEAKPLEPGSWYSVQVSMEPTDVVVPKGHVMGLVITASDRDFDQPVATGAKIDVDLKASHLLLPTPNATGVPPAPLKPPRVTGADHS